MKKLFFLLAILVLGFVLLQFLAKYKAPILDKIKGRRTVAEVIAQIEPAVSDRLRPNLVYAGFKDTYPDELLLLAFKEERILQVFAKKEGTLRRIKSYSFTASSGVLGPKLQSGDRQIPEGIYEVEYLNPNSAFHLSIKVNYPNAFDRAKSTFSNVAEMGGDIFIHGKAASVGCIPIGDPAIEEVFLLTQKALNRKVKIIICPRDFRMNPQYPQIEAVDWENELYDMLKAELKLIPLEVEK
jgi:murein L,D-transpeptidase YafK